MINKTVSSGQVIARMFRLFHPNTSLWVRDAIESIADGLEEIGIFCGYEEKCFELCVYNYKVKIPCNIEKIQVIQKNNVNLPLLQSLTKSKIGIDKNYYYLENNYIKTGFIEGKIEVFAIVLPTDEDGLPLVPDVYEVKNYLAHKAFLDILSTGYKHPVFSYEKIYELLYAGFDCLLSKARNSSIDISIDRLELVKQRWTTIGSFYREAEFNFNNLSILESSNKDFDVYAFTPKDLYTLNVPNEGIQISETIK